MFLSGEYNEILIKHLSRVNKNAHNLNRKLLITTSFALPGKFLLRYQTFGTLSHVTCSLFTHNMLIYRYE